MGNNSKLVMSTMANSGSTGTLAANTALLIVGDVDIELDALFLVKSLQMHFAWLTTTAADTIIVGMAQGDMTIANIATVMLQQVNDPFDFDELSEASFKRGIFWETLTILTSTERSINERFTIGGGKGIPIAEGKGANFFILNAGGGTLTAANFAINATLKGVFLGD